MNRRYHYNIHTRVWIFSIGDIRINIRKQQYLFVFSVLFIPFVLDKKKSESSDQTSLTSKISFFYNMYKDPNSIRECVCETTYSITSVDFCKIRTIILIATLKLINDHWGSFLREKIYKRKSKFGLLLFLLG